MIISLYNMSKFLRQSLIFVITENIWTTDLIFTVILTIFWPICPLTFFGCFIWNSGVHTEFQTEPFIWTTGVDCSNSFNHDCVQVLDYSKYSFLFLPLVGIEPAISRWFHSEAFSNQIPYPLCHLSLLGGVLMV